MRILRQIQSCVGTTLILATAVVFLSAQLPCHANTTNTVPFNDSFENYTVIDTNGTDVIGTNGWYGIAPGVAVAITNDYAYSYTYPLNSSAHTQVLSYDDSTWSTLTAAGGRTNVWVDLMIQAIPTIAPPTEIATNCQVALYINTNGHFVVRHAYYAEDFSAVYVAWSELAHTSIASGDWARVTIGFDYLSDCIGDKYFYICVNGSDPITHALAYDSWWDCGDDPLRGGHLFLCANSGDGGGAPFISMVGMEGIGRIDDMVVTDIEPVMVVADEYTSNGTPYSWLDKYGLTDYENDDNEDSDFDGMDTWQEYLAGTVPTNPSSVFRVLDLMVTEDSNRITWYGTTNSGVFTPFLMYRSTNLIVGWTLLPTNIPRAGSDSNIWWDQSAAESDVFFYRPAVTNP